MRNVFPVREKEGNLKVLAKSPGFLGQRKLLPTAREGYVFRSVCMTNIKIVVSVHIIFSRASAKAEATCLVLSSVCM